MRIVQLNLAADSALTEPGQLLDRYHTLTGWSDAVAAAGADVHVVQRFTGDARVVRGDVCYEFVRDGWPGTMGAWSSAPRVVEAVVRVRPDVVHVNGLMFPGMTLAVRAALPRDAVVVLQDHSGAMPRRSIWPLARVAARRWQGAFRAVDAVSFTARELAARWHPAGLPPDVRILEIPEASTDMSPTDAATARAQTGIDGSPAILWVGRLNANKDPWTVLDGLERAVPTLPRARLWMVVPEGERQDQLRDRIVSSDALRDRVTVLGSMPHQRLAACYSAADIYISGSRHEGSGYALLEALACGVSPCVTDIPAFRALTEGVGERWTMGDAGGCAAALVRAARAASPEQRQHVRRHFRDRLSWAVIAGKTLDAYEDLMATRARLTT